MTDHERLGRSVAAVLGDNQGLPQQPLRTPTYSHGLCYRLTWRAMLAYALTAAALLCGRVFGEGPVAVVVLVSVLMAVFASLLLWFREDPLTWPGQMEQVRATPEGLDIDVALGWFRHEQSTVPWDEVRVLGSVEPKPPQRDPVWHLRAAGYELYLEHSGVSNAIARAAQAAAANRRTEQQRMAAIPEAALSPAEHLTGEEDRGLSKADT